MARSVHRSLAVIFESLVDEVASAAVAVVVALAVAAAEIESVPSSIAAAAVVAVAAATCAAAVVVAAGPANDGQHAAVTASPSMRASDHCCRLPDCVAGCAAATTMTTTRTPAAVESALSVVDVAAGVVVVVGTHATAELSETD